MHPGFRFMGIMGTAACIPSFKTSQTSFSFERLLAQCACVDLKSTASLSRPFCVSGPMRTPDPPDPWGVSCGFRGSSSSSCSCSSTETSGTG